MNQIREIMTKAVVAKGKKTINLNERIKPELRVYSILGCWIINHEFEAKQKGTTVELTGNFEVNVWYSLESNTKTEITRQKVYYNKEINTRQLVTNYIENSDDVLVRIVQHPTCTNANIVDDLLEVEIMFEVIAEIIGETKMQVTVFDQTENWEDEDDFENTINPDFIKT